MEPDTSVHTQSAPSRAIGIGMMPYRSTVCNTRSQNLWIAETNCSSQDTGREHSIQKQGSWDSAFCVCTKPECSKWAVSVKGGLVVTRWRYSVLSSAHESGWTPAMRGEGGAVPRLRGVQEHVDDHDGVDGAAGAKRSRVPIHRRVTEVRRKLCRQQQSLGPSMVGDGRPIKGRQPRCVMVHRMLWTDRLALLRHATGRQPCSDEHDEVCIKPNSTHRLHIVATSQDGANGRESGQN
jgi:hypothetical protein